MVAYQSDVEIGVVICDFGGDYSAPMSQYEGEESQVVLFEKDKINSF